MLKETFSLVRDLPRLHEIASVLIHYGWGDIVRALGIAKLLEKAGRLVHWHSSRQVDELDLPVRIRLALTELGPTYVKLGQVLASRVDVFPPSWIAEFEKLHNQVPPVAFDELRPELEARYGQSLDAVFANFDTEAFAAASIAQVHRATLHDGASVVVKVRRPGIVAKVEADLRILNHVARLMEMELPESRRYRPIQIVSQLRRSLISELDLVREARNIDVFARHFKNDPTVRIPRVYWDYCAEVVNVQEELIGIPGTDLDGAIAAGMDLPKLAARGADVVLKMILIHGHYHADPHPGNVIYMTDDRIGILDFGMVGRLTDARRDQITNFLGALIRKNEQEMLNVLTLWAGDAVVDEDKLAYDLSEIMFAYDDLPLKEIRFGPLLSDITAIMRENNLAMPADLTLLFKALITLEGLGHQLNPDFHMVDHLEPFVWQVIEARYTPDALLKRTRHGMKEISDVMLGLPRDLARLFRQARRGRLRIDLDLKRLDHFGQQLNNAANRLTMGVLTASLVIGSSIIMTVEGGPKLLGMFGFILAFFNGLWIVMSIWRSGKD
jgi:ubiquinone biosynthesis protein